MQRKVIIFHGTGGSPDACWYPWLRVRLGSRGYVVSIPDYPTINKEPIATFLPKVLSDLTFDEQTILIGHSGGAALILSILEHIDIPVTQAILVAGYATPPNTAIEPVLQDTYNWSAIRAHVHDICFINSINDPYGCDDKQGRLLFDRLGGKQIICDEGHFGDYNQIYLTFPSVDALIYQ